MGHERAAVRRAGPRGPGRRYPAVLRQQVVTYLQHRRAAGASPSAVARELGVKRQNRAQADRARGKTGLTTAEREELARLRKENRELRMERDLLKEAAVIFAKHQR